MTMWTEADMAVPANNRIIPTELSSCIKELLLRLTMENNDNVLEGVFSVNNREQVHNNKMTTSLQQTMSYMNERMAPDTSFDIVYRVIEVGGRQACIYFIDGFCKDELMMKILQYFIDLKPADMPENVHEMAKKATPYVEVDLKDSWDEILYSILSGVFALFIDGYDRCILIDSRTYPARGVEEPDKDKTLRGSKD